MRFIITPHATEPCSQKPRTPRLRPPPAPSLLGAVVDGIPKTHRGAVSLQTPGGEGLTDRQLGAVALHDRLTAVEVATPLSVRLRPLPDHVARAVRAPRAAPTPPFRTAASARSPSTGVDGQRPRGGGGTEKQASSAVAPTGRGMITGSTQG